jgi:UDP-2,4-diacetamido-2,4,6-trideoxy-beta-L-altropyranose hydrolase
MLVTIRADASVDIGTGHVMRCLTLAGALREKGAKVAFACRLLDGHLCDLIAASGFEVHRLPRSLDISEDAQCSPFAVDWRSDAAAMKLAVEEVQDWLVVDHYGLNVAWEGLMRPHARNILVIDDLANRSHECDILLDQNYYQNPETRYIGKVPKSCELLLGPCFALLAPQYDNAAASLRARDGAVRRVLVFFGGTDPTGETIKALDAITMLSWPDVHFDIVVGAGNPRKDSIRGRCEALANTTYYCQTLEMARLCSLADVALGAGGSANWERFKLGLPSIVVITAENQRETVDALATGGYIALLGEHAAVQARHMVDLLRSLSKRSDSLLMMSESVRGLMHAGAAGGVQSVVQLMDQLSRG